MRFSILVLFLSLIVFCGCTKKQDKLTECTDQDYAECDEIIPTMGEVKINVTINEENESVRIVIREGNFDTGEIIITDTLNNISEDYYLDVNKTYSAAAYYKKGSDSIVAIDGGKLESYSYKACELRCYDVINISLDLRIK
jgi:hypothetical protein